MGAYTIGDLAQTPAAPAPAPASGKKGAYTTADLAPSGNAHTDQGYNASAPYSANPILHGVEQMGQDVLNAPAAVWQMLRHPLDTYAAEEKQAAPYAEAAKQSLANGDYVKAAAQGGAASVPFVGPLVYELAKGIKNQDWDSVAENAGHLAAMGTLGKIAEAAPEIVTDPAVQAAALRTAKATASGVVGGLKAAVVPDAPLRHYGITLQVPPAVSGAVAGGFAARYGMPFLPHAGEVGAAIGAAYPILKGVWNGVKGGWAEGAPEEAAAPATPATPTTPGTPEPSGLLAQPGRVFTPPAPADTSGPIPFTPPESWNQNAPSPAAEPAPAAPSQQALDLVAQGQGYKSFDKITGKDAAAVARVKDTVTRLAEAYEGIRPLGNPSTEAATPTPQAASDAESGSAPQPFAEPTGVPIVNRDLWAGPNGQGAGTSVKFISTDGLAKYAKDNGIPEPEANAKLTENGYTVLSPKDLKTNIHFRAEDLGVKVGDLSGLSADELLNKYDDLFKTEGPRSEEHTRHIQNKFPANPDLVPLLQKSIAKMMKDKQAKGGSPQ